MTHCVMQYTCYFIVFFCIDQGDGQWKERDRNSLKHDIELYRKLAEKIEHEIEVFYEDNPEIYDSIDDTTQRNRPITATNKVNYQNISSKHPSQTLNITQVVSTTTTNNDLQLELNELPTEPNNPLLEWPKFEDILLEIGKKYDWKKDKWIKVKVKRKTNEHLDNKNKSMKLDNSLEHHEKHKFKYRIVKMKSKNRRNVVVAVSAVR